MNEEGPVLPARPTSREGGDEAIAAGRQFLGDGWADDIEAAAVELEFDRILESYHSWVCKRCWVVVYDQDGHRDWHRLLDAGVKLAGGMAASALIPPMLGTNVPRL